VQLCGSPFNLWQVPEGTGEGGGVTVGVGGGVGGSGGGIGGGVGVPLQNNINFNHQ